MRPLISHYAPGNSRLACIIIMRHPWRYLKRDRLRDLPLSLTSASRIPCFPFRSTTFPTLGPLPAHCAPRREGAPQWVKGPRGTRDPTHGPSGCKGKSAARTDRSSQSCQVLVWNYVTLMVLTHCSWVRRPNSQKSLLFHHR